MLIPGLYSIEDFSLAEASCVAVVRYNASHPLYGGHFPGQPVTPGVCLIQTVIEIIEKSVAKPLQLRAVRQIKFLQMHMPDKALKYEINWKEEGEGLNGRITIFQNDTCIAKINAQFGYK